MADSLDSEPARPMYIVASSSHSRHVAGGWAKPLALHQITRVLRLARAREAEGPTLSMSRIFHALSSIAVRKRYPYTQPRAIGGTLDLRRRLLVHSTTLSPIISRKLLESSTLAGRQSMRPGGPSPSRLGSRAKCDASTWHPVINGRGSR